MGFLDTLGKAAKKGGELAKKGANAVATRIQDAQMEKETKENLLSNFSMNDLTGICKFYGYNGPNPYKTDGNGKRYKIKLDRDNWLDYVMGISIDKIIQYAQNDKRLRYVEKDIIDRINRYWENGNGLPMKTVEPEEGIVEEHIDNSSSKMADKKELEATSKPPQTMDTLYSVLDMIEKDFEVEPVRDEAEFESQLYIFLKTKFGASRVQRQVPFRAGRLDILIDNKHALELKLADSSGNLRSLIGQLMEYKNDYPSLAAIILDVGKLNQQDINYYTQFYEKQGVLTVVLRGDKRGKRGRGNINIKIPR